MAHDNRMMPYRQLAADLVWTACKEYIDALIITYDPDSYSTQAVIDAQHSAILWERWLQSDVVGYLTALDPVDLQRLCKRHAKAGKRLSGKDYLNSLI